MLYFINLLKFNNNVDNHSYNYSQQGNIYSFYVITENDDEEYSMVDHDSFVPY